MKLDRRSIKILRCLSREGSLSDLHLVIFTAYELNDVQERISHLLKKELIQIDPSQTSPLGDEVFRLSPDGEAFLQHRSKKAVLTFITIITSIIVAITGIIAAIATL